MNDTKRIDQTTGKYGVNIAGDGNVVNYYKQPIKYELLSKLCKGIIVSNLNDTEDMCVRELPVELLEKIEYNDLINHNEMYEDLGMYLRDIEDVVSKSLGSESIKLIRVIKTLYCETMTQNPNYNGDQVLFVIEGRLLEHTDLIDSSEYLNEDVRFAISQIVLYVFEKCQILKKPKK